MMLVVVLGLAWLVKQPQSAPTRDGAGEKAAENAPIGPANKTWGHLESLPDHFARHGAEFGARSPEDYAAQAAAFLARARAEGLPAKRDADGALRIYDPATGTFGAYNANGTTRTYFKPGSPTYFERQPGVTVDLRKER